jgi:hypothetical protein
MSSRFMASRFRLCDSSKADGSPSTCARGMHSYQLLRGQLVLHVRVVEGRRDEAGNTECGFHQ